MERVLFVEEQRFTQWWLWTIMILSLLAVVTPFVYGIYSQEVLNVPFGNNPASTNSLIVPGISVLVLVGLIFVIFVYMKLKTKITTEFVMVSFPPFIRKWKKISPDEIDRFEVRTYKAIYEYGGYGIKRGFKSGQSYTVSGNIGLQLYLKNGKKILIGTKKRQAIEYAMRKFSGTKNR